MRKKLKRIVCFVFAVFVMALSFPFEVFAVDPVSSAAIANAFAQAITAYGASNGVSMTFEGVNSGDTAQIGERMHELWVKFREGQQTVDDYETIAAAIFPGLYSKAMNAAGDAVVAVHIAETYMPDVDDFWNWVLSGPAEMVKVDNAYQWNANNGIIQPAPILENVIATINGVNVGYLPISYALGTSSYNNSYAENLGRGNVYLITAGVGNADDSSGSTRRIYFTYESGQVLKTYDIWPDGSLHNPKTTEITARFGNLYKRDYNTSNGRPVSGVPFYSVSENALSTIMLEVFGITDNDTLSDPVIDDQSTYVRPYIGDTVAKPVPIPDTSDPDYGPLPYIGNLPIPWNDTLFGDGTGILTDEQSDAIVDAIDDAIVENPDKTVTLEDDTTVDPDDPTTDDPPSNDPDDYSVPGLQNIFPFCIPFDVYNFLSALAAEPTAPHFTATLQFPAAIGGPQTIDIDFNNQTFNTLAGILRTLELLAFIVGLALLTRSMFIRG